MTIFVKEIIVFHFKNDQIDIQAYQMMWYWKWCINIDEASSPLAESMQWIPFRKFVLPGMYGADQPMQFNHFLLLMDRIFAILSLVLTMNEVYVASNDARRHVNVEWPKLITHSTLAIIVTLLSECMPNQWLYCIVHCLWHIIAFQMAYDLCDTPPSRYCRVSYQPSFKY